MEETRKTKVRGRTRDTANMTQPVLRGSTGRRCASHGRTWVSSGAERTEELLTGIEVRWTLQGRHVPNTPCTPRGTVRTVSEFKQKQPVLREAAVDANPA